MSPPQRNVPSATDIRGKKGVKAYFIVQEPAIQVIFIPFNYMEVSRPKESLQITFGEKIECPLRNRDCSPKTVKKSQINGENIRNCFII